MYNNERKKGRCLTVSPQNSHDLAYKREESDRCERQGRGEIPEDPGARA